MITCLKHSQQYPQDGYCSYCGPAAITTTASSTDACHGYHRWTMTTDGWRCFQCNAWIKADPSGAQALTV